MTEVPRRRGRPPGSKNRVTPTLPTPSVPFSDPRVEQVFGDAPKPAADGNRLLIRWKQALGNPGTEMLIDWPGWWRLPQLNEAIHWKHEGRMYGGFVQFIDFDLTDIPTVIISLR